MPVTTRRSSQRHERPPRPSSTTTSTPPAHTQPKELVYERPPTRQWPTNASANPPVRVHRDPPRHPTQRTRSRRDDPPVPSPTVPPSNPQQAPSPPTTSNTSNPPATTTAAVAAAAAAAAAALPRVSHVQAHRQRLPHPHIQQAQQQQAQSREQRDIREQRDQRDQRVERAMLARGPADRQTPNLRRHAQTQVQPQPQTSAQIRNVQQTQQQQPHQAHGFTAATGTHAPRVFSNPAPLQQIPVPMPPMQMQQEPQPPSQVQNQPQPSHPSSQIQHRLSHHISQGAPQQQRQQHSAQNPQPQNPATQHSTQNPDQSTQQYVQSRHMRIHQPYRLDANTSVVSDPSFPNVKVEYERYPQHVKDAPDHRVHDVQPPHHVFNSQLPPVSQHQHVQPEAGAVHGGQMYMQMHGGVQTLQGVQHSVQGVQNVQYSGQYANQGLFEQLNMNNQGVPMSSVNPQQPVDRQHPHLQQMQSHQGVQVLSKGAVVQDPQVYDQSQQQLLHRPTMQPQHVAHDMQSHPTAQPHMQQHVQHQLYQPMEQQQSAQHLVLNAASGMVQAPAPQQQIMHNQPAQIPHAHVPQQDAHFDQHAYQNAHPSQLSNVNAVGVHPPAESRKNTPATSQQELLMWSSNQGARVVTQSSMQQPPSETPAPQTLMTSSSFAPSQLFETIGMSDMRQQPVSVAQIHQPVVPKLEAIPQSNVAPNVRKLPASTSPRKRRHVEPAAHAPTATPIVNSSGRVFSCSCCGQEFAQKRDRDTHVKTVHERSFSCDKCSARFKTKSDANRHIRIVHDRVRPYQCQSCPSMFSERNKLRRHRQTVHEKLRPYVCPVCSSRFGELGNLRQHTGSVHPGESLDSAQIRSRVSNTQIQQS